MAYSMTGFGAAEGAAAGARLRVEIRTVNHRFFNFAPKLPSDLLAFEGEIRERLRREFDRGHVALQARWVDDDDAPPTLTVDVERARVVVDRLRELQRAVGAAGEISIDLVARQPDVLRWNGGEPRAPVWAEVEPVVAAAAAECRAMRLREGGALVAELEHRLDLLEAAAQAITELAPARLVRERERLSASVAALLDGRQADEQRIAQELAFTADRLDITEELVRFRTHVAASRTAVAAEKPAGKQLGFLAQELGREINTIGSKANDAEITRQVIAMKGELEKFREQLENLE